jgi:hypothetical protein
VKVNPLLQRIRYWPRGDQIAMHFVALHESGIGKGFGCRPLEGRRREFGGRRPKASNEGNRA